MVIDFRMRPPAKGWETMNMHGPKRNVHIYPCNSPGTLPIASSDQYSMSLLIQEMNEAGIDKAVALGRNTGTIWGYVKNEAVANVVKEYPDTFIAGFGSVDPAAGIRNCVDEVQHAVKELGCRGIVIEPGASTPALYPNAAQLYPIYDRCVELGAVIVVSLSHFLGPDVSFQDPTYMQRVCHDFPKGKFVIAHASFPHILPAIAACIAEKNLWLIPDTYMAAASYPGTKLWAEGINYVQGRHMVFGTAYPYLGLKQSIDGVKRFGFRKEYYDLYMYKNALELLEM
ncbi:amidohydrolase family protein [uncultured Mailhella sp.]|uniref:amidohydrolase family protein n=1 Tax=uncultured Mailhella sp. TaxID=1981031 RepID=UPI00261F1D14|nr:amidohydrolase family protein [uncultured Mailhella sp.]